MNRKDIIKYFKGLIFPYYRPTRKFFEFRLIYIICKLRKIRPADPFSIPIIINNFNQLDYLLRLIKSLETRGYKNIHILDNASSFPPLLEYYKQCPYPVYHLGDNYGYLALWKSGMFKKFRNQFFVYTDPDVEIIEDCPKDFMEYFYKIMLKYPLTPKVGFSLKIDDLPDYYPNKTEVISFEKRYWERQLDKGLFDAPIDTTFALYRPFTTPTHHAEDHMIRTDFPYQLRHLPWYVDPDNMSENEMFYAKIRKAPTFWSDKIIN